MGWFSKRAGPYPRVEPRVAAPRNEMAAGPDAEAFRTWLQGDVGSGSFGPAVNETSAMRISTVYACVSLAAGIVASTPLGVYSDSAEKGRVLNTANPLHKLLSVAPMPGRPMTSATWRQLWLTHVWLWGNHYSIIRYNGAGRVFGFEPVHPSVVEVIRNSDGTNLYRVSRAGRPPEYYPQDEMLHFSGTSFDGIKGVSRIQQFARDAAALAAVLEEQTGRVHENAARPSGVYELPPNITPEGRRRIEAYYEERNAGRANAGKLLYTDNGTKYTPLQMSPEDLNTIEARKFQSKELCRFFNTPPHLIFEAADTSAWGSGIEQLTLGYKQFTMHPLMNDFEQELHLKLFPLTGELFPMFDRSALSVMDAKTAAEVAMTEINSGVLFIDERRRQLARPASGVPGANEPLVNSTMIPLSRAMNPPATSAAPAADPKTKAK